MELSRCPHCGQQTLLQWRDGTQCQNPTCTYVSDEPALDTPAAGI